jgi:putative ABC transport system permease protein
LLVALPQGLDVGGGDGALDEALDERVQVSSFEAAQPALRLFLARMRDFLRLATLVTLVLGGLGVAQSIRVFLQQKQDTVAILKVVGATTGEVTAVFVVQCLGLALIGSVLGLGLGVAVQQALPRVVGELLPVAIVGEFVPVAALEGLAVGVITALLFCLLPLLAIRGVAPAQILRRELAVIPPVADRRARALALLVLGGGLDRAGDLAGGVVVARDDLRRRGRGGAAGARGGQRGGARAAASVAAGGLAERAPGARQFDAPGLAGGGGDGVARARGRGHRPDPAGPVGPARAGLPTTRQPTRPTSSSSASCRIRSSRSGRCWPRRARREGLRLVPIVQARLARIAGREVADMQFASESGRTHDHAGVRDHVAGRDAAGQRDRRGQWWTAGGGGARVAGVGVGRAGDNVDLQVGDELVFDIQGVRVPTTVESVRAVDWGQLQTNFVFILTKRA